TFTRGTTPYTVIYTGPQSGDNTVNGNALSINDAPPGTYTFTVTDANGCTETETVTLEATTSDLRLQAALIPNECDQYNQIWIDIFNGTGPFSIEVIRLCDGTTLTDFVSGEVGFELFDLEPCDYKIIVVDAAGCMVMDTITVFPAPIDLFDLTSASGECNELGSFNVQGTGGRAPFTYVLSGPIQDSVTTDATSYGRDDLVSGDYTVFVTDSIGCIETDQFTINNTTTDLDLVTSLIFNDCGQLNQLWNDINGGVPPFTVEVTRLCDNEIDTTFTTSEREFEIFDATPCDYKLKVTDATGCMDMETINVQSSSANLFDLEMHENCDSSGFTLDFIAGEGPYRVVITGPITEQFMDVTEGLYIPAPPGDYSLRAWSNNGCSEMNFSTLESDGTGALPDVGFTTTGSDLAVTFTNTSGPGAVSWDFGDGSSSDEANPQHLFDAAGTYTVCLTVTNGCGANQSCENVQVAASSNVQVVIGGASSFAGGSVRVPVSIQGVDNLATIAGTFALEDPNLATFTGVSAGAITPQFNPDNNSFSFVAAGSDGMVLGDNITTLFFIHLDLGNGVGVTDIDLVDTPVGLEVSAVQNGVPILLTPGYLPGFVEVSANLLGTISSLAHTTNGDEVEDADYELSDPDGTYLIDLPRDADGIPTTLAGLSLGQMYYVQPVRDGDPRNGLSSFEIFLGQRWLLGYDVPQITSPLQIVAADMNCSQSFTNLDLMLMQRLLLEELDRVPGCNTWTFVPETHQFATDWDRNNIFPVPRRAEIVLERDTMVMFTGLKTGDLLFDADPGRSTATLPLTVATEGLRTGEVRELTVRLPEERSLVSLQGVLQVAPGLELLSVAPGDLPTLAVGESYLERGEAAISWFSQTGQAAALPAGAGIVSLTVRATTDLAATVAPVTFDVRNPRVVGAAYDGDLGRLTPRVEGITPASPVFRLLPAAPNPTTEFTNIRFELPAAAAVEVTVFDGLGRQVLSRRQQLAAGSGRFRLDLRGLAAGVYTYRVRAGADAGSGRIVRE
ncbi:MAG: PKD domain-containing protein, partial [Bacteroidota bacterium]